VRWVVTQPVAYDAASSFIPKELLAEQRGGQVQGLHFELAWRYDPDNPDVQPEVWHVVKGRNP
jgi:hypothetical protein